ncbi:GerMN domain-containing protein, partial [bacterium]|nr:GerMN domain-containing protein [bacterium]
MIKRILTFIVSQSFYRGRAHEFWKLFKTILMANIFVLLILSQTAVFAANIYVPDDYSTIQAAVDAASPGDTIIIRDGTYIDNVEIDKNLTIKSESGAEKTIVQAANSEYHVFDVIADYININGFTISGAGERKDVMHQGCGIFLENVEHCIISNNIISKNWEGISLDYSNNNTITKNNINSNELYGISLLLSNNNTITKNNINSNDSKGHWVLAKGIDLVRSNGNIIYLNNFTNNGRNIYLDFEITCIWDSTSKITYTYKGNTYTNNLGNYWDDYTGIDAGGDGIGDTPYSIKNRNKDRRPLMQPFENYTEGNFGDGNTGTDNKGATDSTKKTITATETPNSDNFFTLDSLVDSLQNLYDKGARGVTSKEEKISVEKNEVEPLPAEMIEVNIYFSDSQAMYLVPERRKILKTSTLARHIINELIKGPASPDLYPTIPQGTQVNEVYIAGDIVYIDLSEEVFKNHPGGSSGQLMTVYSIVNTLTEIPPI